MRGKLTPDSGKNCSPPWRAARGSGCLPTKMDYVELISCNLSLIFTFLVAESGGARPHGSTLGGGGLEREDVWWVVPKFGHYNKVTLFL